MKRTALERKGELKRGGRLRRGNRKRTDLAASARFHQAARDQQMCAVTKTFGPWEAHHVVEAQWLKRNRPELLWDLRNALRLIMPVHTRHTAAVKRVPMYCLRDENLEFAFEVMGAAAHVYLHRMYAGTDPRVDRLLERHAEPNVTVMPANWVTNDAA